MLPARPTDLTACVVPGSTSIDGAHQARRPDCDGGFNCVTGCALDERYRTLIREIATEVRPHILARTESKLTNPGLKWDLSARVETDIPKTHPLHRKIKGMVDAHITPIMNTYFDPWCPPILSTVMVSQNFYEPEEDARGMVGAWHWDGGGKGQIKLTLYLQDVDHETACFMMLRHNETGEPFLMDGSRPWGVQTAPIMFPREWLSELFEKGYRPHCVSGPAGSFLLFSPNVVHRGTRPKPGKERLVMRVAYKQSGQGRRENGHCRQPKRVPAVKEPVPPRSGSQMRQLDGRRFAVKHR